MERKKTVVEYKKEWKFNVYENYSYIKKEWDEFIILSKYIGTETEVIVPTKIGRRTVRAIDEKAFYNNKNITDVTIPESVVGLGCELFKGCVALKKVTILSKAVLLEEDCFCDCLALEEVSADFASALLGDHIFQNCPKMMDQNGLVIVEDGNKKFLLDAQLPVLTEEVIIPDGVTHIIGGAFSETYFYEYPNVDKIKKVVLPESVVEIGENCFADCKNLECINIPEGIERIGELAFCDCVALQEIGNINNGCKIGACAFWGCKKIDDERLIRYNSIPPIGRRDLLWLYFADR